MTRTSGSMPKWRAHNTVNRATDVRELASRATVRTRSIGTRLKTATDATGPSDPMATPGTATYESPRRYSMEGTRPTSTWPA